MARGKKNTSAVASTGGVWNFITRDKSLNEEGKIPNFVFEDILGIFVVDTRAMEIVKLKTVTVTDENITSIGKLYGEKYSVGDKFQEWCSLYGNVGCYPNTLEGAFRKIKEIAVVNEFSKQKKTESFDTVLTLLNDIDKRIKKCLETDVIPKGVEVASKTLKQAQEWMDKIMEMNEMYESMKKEYSSLMSNPKRTQKGA